MKQLFQPQSNLMQMQHYPMESDPHHYLDDEECYENPLCVSDPSSNKRSHQSSNSSGLRKSPNKWTKDENHKLGMLVTKYGEKKWKRISAEMGGQKTGAQCAQHWKRVLSPEIRKGPWDEDEEALLFRMVNQHGSSWKKIAKKISRRTDIQCRYQYLKARQSRQVKWTVREDDALAKKVVEMFDKIMWLEVADHMAKLKHTSTLRTALECKERYLILAGVDDAPCVPASNVDYCSPIPTSKSEIGSFEYDLMQDCFGRVPTNTRSPLFFADKNNSFKEYSPDFPLQMASESGNNGSTGVIFVERRARSCSHKACCCSLCSECKTEPWSRLESLAAVASVLPRELLF